MRGRRHARRPARLAAVAILAAAVVGLGSSEASGSACFIPWCTYYSATPPANQYQCGNRCARTAKTHNRMSANATPAHRMELMEVNDGGIIPGTQVFSTGTNAGVAHANLSTNQYCRINTSMHIKCDWY